MVQHRLDRLQPERLWGYFFDLCRIPRRSGEEQRAVEFIVEWARRRDFDCEDDDAGNVVVRVPATKDATRSECVVVQAHLDMVAEALDPEFDFRNEPIVPVLDGDYVRAEGTTLGADNGIGVAAALALADEEGHGPLELLFTVDEERGLAGAKRLDPELISGRRVINVDSEEENFFVGSAGARDLCLDLPIERCEAPDGLIPMKVEISGLRGGHSGVSIHECRANAIKVLAAYLDELERLGVDYRLVEANGGSGRNAIARRASAVFLVEKGAEETSVAAGARALQAIDAEYSEEKNRSVGVERITEGEEHLEVLTAQSRDQSLALLQTCPHGVHALSQQDPLLVETSSNLAVLSTLADRVRLRTLTRSLSNTALEAQVRRLERMAQAMGAVATRKGGYGGWMADRDSALIRSAAAAFEDVTGRAPELKAVHAGLECGVLAEKLPSCEMLSMGPRIEGAHTPDERVHAESVRRFYEVLRRAVRIVGGAKIEA